MDLTVAEQFYLLKKKIQNKERRTPFLLKIVTWVVFGNFKQFGSPWNFNEFSITKFHKVSHILEHFFKFTEIFEISWNIILDTILKFHICLQCYEISLNIEILIKFHESFNWNFIKTVHRNFGTLHLGPRAHIGALGPWVAIMIWPRHL